MTTVAQWLEGIGLSQYIASFEDNAIEMEHLAELDQETLKELGVKALGHRLSILKAVRSLTPSANDPTPTPPSAATSTEAQRRQLTVMFCDLVSSVALGEAMELEDYRELLGDFRQTVMAAVTQHNGYIARHQGDGLLVYFGYPTAHESDAKRSVRAGLQIVEAVATLNKRSDVDVLVRVGIATGPVVVGDVLATASSTESEHAAFGTTPNLAARLQGQAEPDTILISATTYSLVSGEFDVLASQELSLKGMAQSVFAYQVVAERTATGWYGEVWTEDQLPLIGRETEFSQLRNKWHKARQGTGQVVVLSSQPGLGKSRLLRALVAEVQREGSRILPYHCSAFHENSTLFPLLDQLSHDARITLTDTSSVRRRKLRVLLKDYLVTADARSRAVENLIDQACMTDDSSYQFAQQAEQRLDGLVDIIADMATQQPVLLIIEDVQWADPSTLALIMQLFERVASTPILFIITQRGSDAFMATQLPHVESMKLAPLNDVDSAALASACAQGITLDSSVLQKICERGDGIPLYVREITHGVVQVIRDQQSSGESASGTGGELQSIPERLQDSLMSRLDRLGPAKLLAQVGSVIGRRFEHSLLEAVLKLAGHQLVEMIQPLLLSELVTVQGSAPNAVYVFNHALVQEAAYQSLLKQVKSTYHARCAQVLVELFPHIAQTQPERIAQHYADAKNADQAVEYWSIAARRALSRSAYKEAIKSADNGRALLGNIQDRQQRAHLEISLLNTVGHATDMSEGPGKGGVKVSYERALKLGQNTGNESERFLTLLGMWRGSIARSELQRAQHVAANLLQVAQTMPGPVPRIVAHMTTANTHFHVGEFNHALYHVQQGLAIYDPQQRNETGSPMFMVGQDPIVSLEYCGALSSWLLGRPQQAREHDRRGLATARALNQPYSLSMALVWTSMLHQFDEDLEGSEGLVKELVELSEAYALPWSLGLGLTMFGWLKIKTGSGEDGLAQMKKGVRILHNMTESSFKYFAFGLLADGYRILGRGSDGLEAVAQTLAWFKKSGVRWDASYMLRLRGRLALMTGDDQLAESSLRESIDCATEMAMIVHDIDSRLLLAEFLHAKNRTDEAIVALEHCLRSDEQEHQDKLQKLDQLLNRLKQD